VHLAINEVPSESVHGMTMGANGAGHQSSGALERFDSNPSRDGGNLFPGLVEHRMSGCRKPLFYYSEALLALCFLRPPGIPWSRAGAGVYPVCNRPRDT
jgi:hypothetical protein